MGNWPRPFRRGFRATKVGAEAIHLWRKAMTTKLFGMTAAAILLALHPLPAVAAGLLYDVGCPVETTTQAAKSPCENSFIIAKHNLGMYYSISVLHIVSKGGYLFNYEEDIIVDCAAGSVWDPEQPVHERQHGNINFQLLHGIPHSVNKEDVNLYFAVCKEEPQKYK
jgi:hypothetical protein